MDNVIKALMRCRNTDNEFPPEIANPHYFKMPNGQDTRQSQIKNMIAVKYTD